MFQHESYGQARLVKEVKNVFGENGIFKGFFDEKGYTGKADHYLIDNSIPKRIISGSYKPFYYYTYYNFPKNFIPKKDSIYLCIISKSENWEKGNKRFTRISLSEPLEIVDDNFYTAYQEKTSSFHYGYLSPSNILYATSDEKNSHYNTVAQSRHYPIEFGYYEKEKVFFSRSDEPEYSFTAIEHSQEVYNYIGNEDITKTYVEFNKNLKELVKRNIDSCNRFFKYDELKNVFPVHFDVRSPNLLSLGMSLPHGASEELCEVTFLFEIQYKDDGWKKCQRVFAYPASIFNNDAIHFLNKWENSGYSNPLWPSPDNLYLIK